MFKQFGHEELSNVSVIDSQGNNVQIDSLTYRLKGPEGQKPNLLTKVTKLATVFENANVSGSAGDSWGWDCLQESG